MHLDRSSEISELGKSLNVGLGSTLCGYGIQYKQEKTVNSWGQHLGSELLIASSLKDVESILMNARDENMTIQLYGKVLHEAFYNISQGIPGFFSINTYLSDVGNRDFRHMTNSIMRKFKRKDRHSISIEVTETAYGNINKIFIENIIWLYEQGFHLAIDDLDIFRTKKDDVSNELLRVIGSYCTKIKLDWQVTQELKENKKLQRYLRDLRQKYPDKTIVMEGIHKLEDIRVFTHADNFQLSSYLN